MAIEWSDDKSLLTKTMWEYGFSVEEIAKELGDDFTPETVRTKIREDEDIETDRLIDVSWITIDEIYEEIKPQLKATKTKKKEVTKKETSKPKAEPKKTKPATKDAKTPSKAKSPTQPEVKPESKPKTDSEIKAKSPPEPKPQPQPKAKAKPTNKKITQREEGSKKPLSIMELTEFTCRWPFGDPQETGFHFCGKMVEVGEVYCLEHCLDAYQNYATRKEEREKAAQQEAKAQK